MIQDMHSHTYYSFCGLDKPEAVIEGMVSGGIKLMGICDHNYGIVLQRQIPNIDRATYLADYQRALSAYLDHMRLLQEKYRDQIEIKCGIEIATSGGTIPELIDISQFDYCLVEHIDWKETVVKDLFAFAERCGCEKVGIAHTDLAAFLNQKGMDKLSYFSEMAKRNIFWELNVNYDSVHGFREHGYVKNFFADEALQEVIRKSGVELSVGFDGHRIREYAPERVITCCEKLKELNLPLVFER